MNCPVCGRLEYDCECEPSEPIPEIGGEDGEDDADAELSKRERLALAIAEAVKAEEKPQTHRPAALPHYTDRDEIAENDGRTWGNK